MIAYRFGALTFDSRLFGFSYIIVSFFLLPFTLIYFSSNNSKQQTYEYEVNYLDASTGSSRILFDYELHKSKTKYNLFSGQKSAEMNVPDTSVLIEKNQSQLIGPDGVINYDLNLNTFGQSGQILLTSDTSSYSYKDIRMSGLRFFRVNFDNGDEGLFWIHNQNKLVVKSEYYDYQGQLLKSSKLLSIQ